VAWQELFPSRGALVLALFVCVLAPATLVGLQIDKNPRFSPIDEAAHFDYVERVSRGEIPRTGQRLTQTTLRELACRGSLLPGLRAPPCDTPVLRFEQFSASWQYEAQHPPTYYALTVPLRWAALKLGANNLLTATRVTGIVWLMAGLLLLWAAGRVMSIDPLPLAAGLLLLAASPMVVYGTAIVNNDVTAIPAAGLVALAAALAYRGRLARTSLVLFGAGAVAAALKASNFFPVVTFSVLFAIAAWLSHRGDLRAALRRWLPNGGALLLGGLVATLVWTVIHRSRALIDLSDEPTFAVLRGTPRTPGLVIREAADLLRPLTNLAGGFVPLSRDTLDQNIQAPFYTLLSFLLLAGGLAGLFVSPRRWYHALGLVSVPALYLGGVALGVSLMLTYDADPGLSGRYGLAMAPLLMLAMAASLTGRWAKCAVAIFAAAYFCTMLGVMVT
jgi:hypothetical protein